MGNILTLTAADEAREFVYALRRDGKTVGIVPTMGALHQGHLSLARASTERCDATIATIFVNPTQFAPDEDLDKYPRTLDADRELLQNAGVDAVFVPDVQTMYPPGFSTFVQPPDVAKPLEGTFRPDHFRGVTTIVMKLFQLLPATHAFFGQKDYQQLQVIQAMVRDLNVGIEIVSCPIVREPDGLALSSRNRYLNDEQRQRALLLSESLAIVDKLVVNGERNVKTLESAMHDCLSASEMSVDKIDYAVVVQPETLRPLDQLDSSAIALIAAYVGQTRLIDNAFVQP